MVRWAKLVDRPPEELLKPNCWIEKHKARRARTRGMMATAV
jgi:hypothetical protein